MTKAITPTTWYPFNHGQTVGRPGSEGGIILRDEEYLQTARITLEKKRVASRFVITCGVYGWMLHTRFFDTETLAAHEYESMKVELERIAALISREQTEGENSNRILVTALSDFIEKFP